jgi:hypothetical protein
MYMKAAGSQEFDKPVSKPIRFNPCVFWAGIYPFRTSLVEAWIIRVKNSRSPTASAGNQGQCGDYKYAQDETEIPERFPDADVFRLFIAVLSYLGQAAAAQLIRFDWKIITGLS